MTRPQGPPGGLLDIAEDLQILYLISNYVQVVWCTGVESKEPKVASMGIEPMTLALLAPRSDHLS